MKLEFKKYERTESTLESLGTVVEQIGQGGRIDFIPRNLKDTTKRVVAVLSNKAGNSVMVTCSKQVSDGVRDKSITAGHILNFEILADETNEVPYICLPGGGLIGWTVKELEAKEYTPSTTVNHEDLIAL